MANSSPTLYRSGRNSLNFLMKTNFILDEKEVRELEYILAILMSAAGSFDTATDPDEDNDDICESVEEVRSRLSYDMKYVAKAETVLRDILHGKELTDSVRDFELSK